MKKITMLFACLGLIVLGFGTIAHALDFSDVRTLDQYISNGETYSWEFDLNNNTLTEGDINSEDTILPGGFYLENGNLEFAITPLLTITFADDNNDPWSYLFEYRSVTTDTGTTLQASERIATILFPYSILDVYSEINSDHFMTVSVNGTGGDFRVTGLSLAGDYLDNPTPNNSVPEPATMLLLGMGLLGMGFIGRRRFKK